MTEKLLCKPPFRYLHDIFTATNGATGFGNGLYSGPELDGKAIADKDGKISYLTKMITLTELVIGEEIDVRPAKIVAGQEPEKTNYLLQQMFKAATAGIDTTPHVNQVLGVEGDDGGEGEDAEDDEAAQAQAAQEAAEAAD
jgi:TRAF3-interacting protein 1